MTGVRPPRSDTATAAEPGWLELRQGRWELEDEGGHPYVPVPTQEGKTPEIESVYALTKFDQERLALIMGRAYGIPTVALRFFNVYGPRQALSNPYTGVLAIFASRLLNGAPPLLFEDGQQRRDFVSVHDVAAACVLAEGACCWWWLSRPKPLRPGTVMQGPMNPQGVMLMLALAGAESTPKAIAMAAMVAWR